MNETRLRALYAQMMQQRETQDRTSCVSPEDLSSLVQRTVPVADRLALLDHVMSCVACHREFELLRAVHAAVPRRRFTSTRWLALAASLVLVVGSGLLWVTMERSQSPAGVTRGASPVISLVSPDAQTTASLPITFVWQSVPNAAHYVVEVFDSLGVAALSTTTSDTTLLWSPEHSVPGGKYLWSVRAEARGAGQAQATPRPLLIQTR